jgi:hypothetical protein
MAEPGKVRLHFPGICGDRHVFSLFVGCRLSFVENRLVGDWLVF